MYKYDKKHFWNLEMILILVLGLMCVACSFGFAISAAPHTSPVYRLFHSNK